MTNITLKPEKGEVTLNLTQINAQAISAKQIANTLEITNDLEAEVADEMLMKFRRQYNEIEDIRKNEVKPFNELIKRINNILKPILNSFDEAEGILKKKRAEYLKLKEKAIEEENRKRLQEFQQKVAEEQQKAKEEKRDAEIINPPAVVVQEAVRTAEGAISAKKEWIFEIVNIHELYKAAPELVELKPKIREIKERIKNGEQIPGLRVYQDYVQRVRLR